MQVELPSSQVIYYLSEDIKKERDPVNLDGHGWEHPDEASYVELLNSVEYSFPVEEATPPQVEVTSLSPSRWFIGHYLRKL